MNKFAKSVGSFAIQIPSKVEVQFFIDNSEDFVESTLLALYRRHVANKGLKNGKGFNYATAKDGQRLGRWLDTKGKFTDGTGKWSRTREQHLAAARQVLKKHVDQILTMMIEKAEAKKPEPKVSSKPKALETLPPEIQAMVRERTAEVLALMNEANDTKKEIDQYEDEEEPITVREPRFHKNEYVVI